MKLSLITVPAGSEVFIGAPASPLPESFTNALKEELSRIPNLLEAHLPQCYVKGVIDNPSQVLVLVAKDNHLEEILETVRRSLSEILDEDSMLDIWPMDKSNKLIRTMREAGCKLHEAKSKKRFVIF